MNEKAEKLYKELTEIYYKVTSNKDLTLKDSTKVDDKTRKKIFSLYDMMEEYDSYYHDECIEDDINYIFDVLIHLYI